MVPEKRNIPERLANYEAGHQQNWSRVINPAGGRPHHGGTA